MEPREERYPFKRVPLSNRLPQYLLLVLKARCSFVFYVQRLKSAWKRPVSAAIPQLHRSIYLYLFVNCDLEYAAASHVYAREGAFLCGVLLSDVATLDREIRQKKMELSLAPLL